MTDEPVDNLKNIGHFQTTLLSRIWASPWTWLVALGLNINSLVHNSSGFYYVIAIVGTVSCAVVFGFRSEQRWG